MNRLLRMLAAIAVIALLATFSTSQTTAPQSSPAQTVPKDLPDRQHALDVYRAGKFVEAMPLLEKLSADNPSDIVVKEYWAFSVMAYASTIADPDLKKRARVRARAIALEAKQLGDTSSLLQVILEIPEDGAQAPFSDRKDVDDAMKNAEADFVRGDFDKARDGYLHVMMLDPRNYEAALFMGDVYFKQHINGSAGEWFARAVEIDPNRETAYRYWGDALMDLGRPVDAREKYILAIIAEPYKQRSWVGLQRWAERTKLSLTWVRLQDKSSVTQKDESHINITLDPSGMKKGDPAGSAWLIYAMNRALWTQEKFKKEFPNEPKYRRTMREEADCLHMMVTVMTEQKDFEKKKKNLDSPLLELVKIDGAGFLEPFTLLNRADNDIAQDYVPYRTAHRDALHRYFDEYVVPKAPQQ